MSFGKAAVAAGLALALAGAAAGSALAETPLFTLSIKDHRFVPDRLEVPADKQFRLEVRNEDNGPAEFESKRLKLEKIVAPGKVITLNVGPLKPGEYPFVEEFHEDVAKGVIVAK